MPGFSANDRERLLQSLAGSKDLLIIQDLDGVCMGLVRDPLTRTIERRYVEAARKLAGHFYVLTNGEHAGRRGVDAIIERTFASRRQVREEGLYLPGLGAGGVQLQDCHGNVSHPGVTDRELAFLRTVPDKAARFLATLLAAPEYAIAAEQIAVLVRASVLDNPLSPTVNLNALYRQLGDRPARYRALQERVCAFMESVLQDAAEAGLDEAFFVHYAPNLGRDAHGRERVSPGGDGQAGTTDIQFMLRGAVKEAGVLVLLNHYLHARTGTYPLGEAFNVRRAPQGHQALLELARRSFDSVHMPRIVGVGDTLTSRLGGADGTPGRLRGGSDRGFLQLVQDLGDAFGTDNAVLFVDSSGDEVQRPTVDGAALAANDAMADAHRNALEGISDAQDPLHLDLIFMRGHAQYVDFFCALAERHAACVAAAR